MECSTLIEQARHWANTQPDKIWMRDLNENGADEYTWGETIAEIDRVAAGWKQSLVKGSVWRCSQETARTGSWLTWRSFIPAM